MTLTQKEMDMIDNLFKDYHILAKSHDRLMHTVSVMEEDLNDCCSTSRIVERELAHTTLNTVVEKLEVITDKLSDMEKSHMVNAVTGKKVSELEAKVNKLMVYSSMVLGGLFVIEYFGLLKG